MTGLRHLRVTKANKDETELLLKCQPCRVIDGLLCYSHLQCIVLAPYLSCDNCRSRRAIEGKSSWERWEPCSHRPANEWVAFAHCTSVAVTLAWKCCLAPFVHRAPCALWRMLFRVFTKRWQQSQDWTQRTLLSVTLGPDRYNHCIQAH